MTISTDWAVAWLIAVSITAFAVAVWDKSSARHRRRRVPERVLWLIAAVGGAGTMWLTFLLIRHKTTRPGFMWGLPLLAAVQAVGVYALIYTEKLFFV